MKNITSRSFFFPFKAANIKISNKIIQINKFTFIFQKHTLKKIYIQSKIRTAFRSKNNVSKGKSVFAIGLAEESNGKQIKGDIWSVEGVAGKSKCVVLVGK